MKVLILMSYFNRPKLVINALNSIKQSNLYHQDWELVFGDDSSPIPGKPIVERILSDHLEKVKFVHTNMTLDQKLEQGIKIGYYANQAILESNADIAITLSDDDELVPSYLKEISNFFQTHSDIMYCYSQVRIYNPLIQTSEKVGHETTFNQYKELINPVNKVDASQVAFRLTCCKQYNVKFPETTLGSKPWINNIDGGFFQQLYDQFGPAHPSGLTAQYKGIHDYQLVWHKKQDSEGLREYIKKVTELGGERF